MAKMHLSLIVRDLASSIKFYEAFFGQPPHKLQADYANFDVAQPPLKLALVQGEAAGKGSLDHLGILLESADMLELIKTRMVEAGLTTFAEEEVECCYAKQDKIWVTDPDGHSWEVYVLLDDMLGVDFKDREMQMVPGFRSGPDGCCGQE